MRTLSADCKSAAVRDGQESSRLYAPAIGGLLRCCELKWTVADKKEWQRMRPEEIWVPFSWHCSNCGAIVTGYKNQNNDIKVQCSRCQVVMVRRFKSRKHDTIDLFAPEGQERQSAL